MRRKEIFFILAGVWELSACASMPKMADSSHDTLSAAEHVTLGNAYLAHGEKAPAVQQYESAVVLDRRYVPALMALGNMAFDDHDWKKARGYFRRALKAAPGSPGIMNNLAMVDVAEGTHLDRAERLIDQALTNAGSLTPYLLDTKAQIAKKRAIVPS